MHSCNIKVNVSYIYLSAVYIRFFDQKTWSQYNGQMGSEGTLKSPLQFKIIVNNEL